MISYVQFFVSFYVVFYVVFYVFLCVSQPFFVASKPLFNEFWKDLAKIWWWHKNYFYVLVNSFFMCFSSFFCCQWTRPAEHTAVACKGLRYLTFCFSKIFYDRRFFLNQLNELFYINWIKLYLKCIKTQIFFQFSLI